jgi:uncharacterized protein (DUF58 family)
MAPLGRRPIRERRRPLRATLLIGRLIRLYEDRLTARGRALFVVTSMFALLGADTRRTQIFKLFAIAAALLVVSSFFAQLRRRRFRLECALPLRATAKAPVRIKARVASSHGGPVPALHLHFPRPLRSADKLPFAPRAQPVSIGSTGTAEVATELTPLQRGQYLLRGPLLSATDPLGLMTGPPLRQPDQPLLVYPRYFSLDDFPIPLGRRYQPGGIPLSSSIGDAIEFVGTRDYRAGDPVRNIHWRSWARRGEPVVKEYQEEYFCRIALVLDTFLPRRPKPAESAGFEASISLLASIADFFSRSEYIVDILAAGPDVYEVSAGRSLAYLENILDVLACIEPCDEPPFQTIGPHLFEKLGQLTTVVVILQDWDHERLAFLRRVHSLGTGVRALIVHDGPTRQDWGPAADEFDGVEQRTPADVERSLEAARG